MRKKILSLFTVLSLVLGGTVPSITHAEGSVLSLSQAIQIAIENNPTLGESTQNEKGAEYARQSAKADFFPNLSANYTFTALDHDPYMIPDGEGSKMQIGHGTQYNWGVTLVQPLFAGHAISSRYEIAKLGVAIKEKEKRQTVLDITKGVKSAYYHLLLNQKLLVVADEAIETLGSHERDAQLFFDHGVIRRNDLLRAKVALADAVQSRERSRANVDIARADLNRWLADDINAETRIQNINDVTCAEYQLGPLIEKGLKQRPQLQAMALARETLEKTIKLEKSTYYPQVSAVGSYWQDGDSLDASNNDFSNDHNASISLQATWTFFDANKTRSRVSKAKSDKKAYDQRIRHVADLVRFDIKNAYLDLGVAEHNIATAKVAWSQAEENLRITRLGYRRQAATSTEVLDARTDLTQAKTNYYQALYGYLDALAALERAVGQQLKSEPGVNPAAS
ncbi:transporter [Desulfosarcina ovata subsp. sediminis]|uniref:Transporter n=1 Tax=Desulfosarcina ovata subsp. sediminis TaxID=885957 RepID=A0A5K7ZRB6_9BACT|nr:TolC family protein [Desulfosarcina ovata]BBO81053.1 transporter [Desulfosarcina ovata subsp. sediminis]